MDKKSGLSNVLYPEFIKSDYIFVYSSLNAELEVMIGKSGYKEEFIRKYRRALKFLEQLKEECFHQSRLFEKLKNSNGLHSIKIKGEKNIRILFVFAKIHKQNYAVLLYAFQEKSNSKNSKEGYKDAVKIASERAHLLTISN